MFILFFWRSRCSISIKIFLSWSLPASNAFLPLLTFFLFRFWIPILNRICLFSMNISISNAMFLTHRMRFPRIRSRMRSLIFPFQVSRSFWYGNHLFNVSFRLSQAPQGSMPVVRLITLARVSPRPLASVCFFSFIISLSSHNSYSKTRSVLLSFPYYMEASRISIFIFIKILHQVSANHIF